MIRLLRRLGVPLGEMRLYIDAAATDRLEETLSAAEAAARAGAGPPGRGAAAPGQDRRARRHVPCGAGRRAHRPCVRALPALVGHDGPLGVPRVLHRARCRAWPTAPPSRASPRPVESTWCCSTPRTRGSPAGTRPCSATSSASRWPEMLRRLRPGPRRARGRPVRTERLHRPLRGWLPLRVRQTARVARRQRPQAARPAAYALRPRRAGHGRSGRLRHGAHLAGDRAAAAKGAGGAAAGPHARLAAAVAVTAVERRRAAGGSSASRWPSPTLRSSAGQISAEPGRR